MATLFKWRVKQYALRVCIAYRAHEGQGPTNMDTQVYFCRLDVLEIQFVR